MEPVLAAFRREAAASGLRCGSVSWRQLAANFLQRAAVTLAAFIQGISNGRLHAIVEKLSFENPISVISCLIELLNCEKFHMTRGKPMTPSARESARFFKTADCSSPGMDR